MIANLNTVKCPQCNSQDKSMITNGFFHCNQCGSNYYGNKNATDGFIVKSGKASIISPPCNSQFGKQPIKKSLLPILIVCLLVMCISTLFIKNMIRNQNTHRMAESDVVETNMVETDVMETDVAKANVIEETIDIPLQNKSYSRTAYILHKNSASQQFLYKATFLTQNMDQDDAKAVLIKQKGSNGIVGYDALTNKIIPNFKKLTDKSFSLQAIIVYADKNNLIVKNKIHGHYQLEMIDPYTGNLIWTLSDKELMGIEQLTGKYNSEKDEGIKLVNDAFNVKLPSRYYILDKKGLIVDFGWGE